MKSQRAGAQQHKGGGHFKTRKRKPVRLCDCWRYERTVCDICQGVDPNNPAKDATTATGNHD